MNAMRAVITFLIALTLASALHAQTSRPARAGGKDKPAIQRAVEQLTAEAQQAKKDQTLAHAEPDFAARFKDDVPNDQVLEALAQPVSRDPFIDAYVRWQLTSFNPPLPALDDRQFVKLMAGAPTLLANPCADESSVTTIEKAEAAPRLSNSDIERLRKTWTALNQRRQAVELLNVPALGWRKWIDDHLPARGPRKIQWLIERVASTVSGGWDARDAKGDLTRAAKDLGRSTGDLALTGPQTQMVCEQIERLQGLRRRYIDDVSFLANGRIDASFFNAYVSDDDIEKWVESLGGSMP